MDDGDVVFCTQIPEILGIVVLMVWEVWISTWICLYCENMMVLDVLVV